jgi:hypothetical protein
MTPEGQGSGCFVHRGKRLIITNYHVVVDKTEVQVSFPLRDPDGKLIVDRDHYKKQLDKKLFIRGEVVRIAKGQDLALVQLDSVPTDAIPVRLSPDGVRPGQRVHSIGSPGASDAMWLYTSGAVRQVSHKTWVSGNFFKTFPFDAQVIETQSPTNPGDSGGPLVDDSVQLVGITQGMNVMSQLMSIFIDVSEAVKILRLHDVPLDDVVGTGKGSTGVYEVAHSDGIYDLIKKLGDVDSQVRARVARQLGEFGIKSAIGPLIAAMDDSDPLVRKEVSEALRRIGTPGRQDIPLLIAALRSNNTELRVYASAALSQMGRPCGR